MPPSPSHCNDFIIPVTMPGTEVKPTDDTSTIHRIWGDTPLCRGIYGDSEVKLTSRQEVKRISAVLWKGGKVGDKTSARVLY